MPTFVISGKKDSTGQKQYAGVRMWTPSLMGTKKCKGGGGGGGGGGVKNETKGVYGCVHTHKCASFVLTF